MDYRETEIGQLPQNWDIEEVGRHFEVNTGKGIHKSERLSKGTYPIMGANGIIGYTDRFLVDGEYILTGRVGTLGEIAFKAGKYWISDNSIYIGAKGTSDLKFLYYYLRTVDFQGLNVGSTQPLVKQSDIQKMKFPLPSPTEQCSIAKILSDLDDKIELNRQMNETSEAMAQAIFKEWFVDFRFPGHEKVKMVQSELGEIPEGWRVGELRELIEITSGKRPSERSDKKDSNFMIPLLGASSIMGFVKETLYDEPIIIIGRVGTHGIIQRIAFPSFPSDNTLVIKTGHYEFVYQILKNIDYEILNVGSTQPLITQSSIKAYRMIIPHKSILIEFEKAISSLFAKMNANNIENEQLSQVRNALLPKLMSGEIRVKDTGKFVETKI